MQIREELVKTALRYKQNGFEKVNLLLLGDVFHRSYVKVDSAMYDCSFFIMWREKIGDCFSVVGNHELSYYKSNPFFSLVSEIESQKLAGVSDRVWAPNGLLPVIRVVDSLECGNVRFYFNHNRAGISRPEVDGSINIGLFHQDVVCSQIKKAAEARLGSDIWGTVTDFESTDVFDGYDYCFFGHMHSIYGTWKLENGTVLCYLASLCRTSVTEVNDNQLERNLPVVKVVDSKFDGIDDNFIRLPSYEECIDHSKVLLNKENYQQAKVMKLARSYSPLDDDPMESLRAYYAEDAYMLKIVDGLLHEPVDPIGESLNFRYNRRFYDN
jgi:DNA repair exonuclease SbcCD nuclease subunit